MLSIPLLSDDADPVPHPICPSQPLTQPPDLRAATLYKSRGHHPPGDNLSDVP